MALKTEPLRRLTGRTQPELIRVLAELTSGYLHQVVWQRHGSHDYEAVLADFHGFFPHVVPGGIVALHDVVETWPGPLRAWQETIQHQLTDVGYCTTLAYRRKPIRPKS